MTIFLSALAVAYTAFCVWLMVRFVNRRERRAKWTLAVLVQLPVLYVSSFGPARVFDDPIQHPRGFNILLAVYWPLGKTALSGPRFVGDPLFRYALMFAPRIWGQNDDGPIHMPIGPSDDVTVYRRP